MLLSILLVLTVASTAYGQTLFETLSRFPALSNFTAYYRDNPTFANAVLGNTSNYPITFLAPSDQAFISYRQQNGISLTSLPPTTLLAVLQYHTLVSNLSKETLTNNGAGSGISVPTLLTSQNNNRSVGISMAGKFGGAQRASGQVVFIKSAGPGSSRFLLSRQAGGSQNSIRSGLSSDVNLQFLNGSQGLWDGGRFHVVDGLLTPPQLCVDTIRNAKLTALDNALNRTALWPVLDGSKNVTCLGPSNQAFVNAGSPDSALNSSTLTEAIKFHTLPEVAYSDYLVDGQEFKTLQNGTVRVKVVGTGANKNIWFNNAKVIDANVLTHNGLVHVLDAVMVPLEQMSGTSSPTGTSKPSATRSGSATGSSSTSTGSASAGAAALSKTISHGWVLWMAISAIALV